MSDTFRNSLHILVPPSVISTVRYTVRNRNIVAPNLLNEAIK